jgi:hypothetical protein
MALPRLSLVASGRAVADCMVIRQGAIDVLCVRVCRAIRAESDPAVIAVAQRGPIQAASLRSLYTGALINDSQAALWMDPSLERDPCRGLQPGSSLRRRAWFSCCDSGSWGPWVFGGRFLSDPDRPPDQAIRSFLL